MSAFSFDLQPGVKCVSKNKISCSLDDGAFKFSKRRIPVGNSLINNEGGIGGFVGPNHEYFLYCGSKYPEIAVAKFDIKTRKWREHAFLQFDSGVQDDKGYFENIWFVKKGCALIFEPKTEYRELMGHEDLNKNMDCIKLSLRTGKFNGITQAQFKKQRHSTLGEDSIWPTSKANHSDEVLMKEIIEYQQLLTLFGSNISSRLETLNKKSEAICATLEIRSREHSKSVTSLPGSRQSPRAAKNLRF